VNCPLNWQAAGTHRDRERGGLCVPAFIDRTRDLAANAYLAPGGTHHYHQVRDDLNALAVDCGLASVPAPGGTS
jgi:hypothetical protein